MHTRPAPPNRRNLIRKKNSTPTIYSDSRSFNRLDIENLNKLISRSLPSNVESVLAPIESLQHQTKRESEFAAGRKCAHASLESFGCYEEVAVAEDRSPQWPNNFCGSISHSDDLAWAVTAQKTDHFRSIGIDTEPQVEIDTVQELSHTVASSSEWDLAGEFSCNRKLMFTLMFSAKESFYKCIYPLGKSFFNFLDVTLTRIDESSLTLKFNRLQDRAVPQALKVRYLVCDRHVFTASWVG